MKLTIKYTKLSETLGFVEVKDPVYIYFAGYTRGDVQDFYLNLTNITLMSRQQRRNVKRLREMMIGRK